ncbi:sodium-coupled monocarboxylate transporter 2-like [Episyrphus balteatus]|uniref:sodium-coupled monocarboxylate transporter 2-like n=1 Tax=Episyrphus balteatus TaxID=286459 RepID=UPI00248691B1|nr:sodium-coupled monocarboxylate transporter 2-like [Episyrphus balteatus]
MTLSNATNATLSLVQGFTFGAVDYAVFTLLLVVSAGIGVYFGFFSGENNTADEYLLGGKRMKPWPIAISLVSSQLSAASVITIPAEIYSYGINFAFLAAGIIFVTPILCFVILPVFYNNNISNCYEYLQLRFNKQTRQLVTFSFVFTAFLLCPVFTFIPALAFSQVTGFNIHLINATVCSICVFYTMFGGIKAVVWTDVIQASVMVLSIILVSIMGIVAIGGIDKVFERAYDGGRLDINWTFDPRTRTSFISCFVGGLCLWTKNLGLNQTCVQRVSALPSLQAARKALLIFTILFLMVTFVNVFTGVLMFSNYFDCDPITVGIVEKPDKMMPFYVQDIVGHLKGMPGVFISCVFSAALGSTSANLNTLAGVCYFDYIKPFIKHTEHKANIIMKTFVFFTGVYCVLGGFVVEKSNSILQTVLTVSGISFGTILGVFFLGLLVPKAHGKPALIGIIVAMILMVGLIFGTQRRMQNGRLVYKTLPSRVDGCDRFNFTHHSSIFTQIPKPIRDGPEFNDEFSIFDISFNWYKFIGAILVWVVAIPLSYIMPNDKKLDPKLLSPVISPFVKYDAVNTEDFVLNEKPMNQ